MLAQAVLSYIAAGWPREQITIIDNSGVMDANLHNRLTQDNPFYLDYHTLRGRYGASVLRTPTMLSFAQLQNYMLSVAMSRGWQYFYWGHMDVAVISDETKEPYMTFYDNVLSSLAQLLPYISPDSPKNKRWGGRHYNFDFLTLINIEAVRRVGTWDPFIPYYNTDCDFYERVRLSGFPIPEERVGDIFDLAKHIPDPESRFFPGPGDEDVVNSARYKTLFEELEKMQTEKKEQPGGRNYWQQEQKGGDGEPWTYTPMAGYEIAWWDFASAGREVFAKKWKTSQCSVIDAGKSLSDMWIS